METILDNLAAVLPLGSSIAAKLRGADEKRVVEVLDDAPRARTFETPCAGIVELVGDHIVIRSGETSATPQAVNEALADASCSPLGTWVVQDSESIGWVVPTPVARNVEEGDRVEEGAEVATCRHTLDDLLATYGQDRVRKQITLDLPELSEAESHALADAMLAYVEVYPDAFSLGRRDGGEVMREDLFHQRNEAAEAAKTPVSYARPRVLGVSALARLST